MYAHDALGFGTLICLDGASADHGALGDVAVARRVVADLIATVEGENVEALPGTVVIVDHGEDGHSAALVRGESSIALHAFKALRSVTLQFFSVRDVPLSRTTKQFLEAYRVGRFQSSVRGRGLILPRDPQVLTRLLRGEREYARLRVVPAERVTL